MCSSRRCDEYQMCVDFLIRGLSMLGIARKYGATVDEVEEIVRHSTVTTADETWLPKGVGDE